MKILKYNNIYCDISSDEYYLIENNGNIVLNKTKNSILRKPKYIHYHDDNIYVILSSVNVKTNTVYRLDLLMALLFLENDIIKRSWKSIDGSMHFNVIHLDGNSENNNIQNLYVVPYIEQWKIISFENVMKNTYCISNIGNVVKINNNVVCKQHKAISYINGKEYKRVSLKSNDGKFHEYRVHRLIAHEFIDKNFPNEDDLEVNHIDGNTSNNRLDNLEICSPIINTKHAYIFELSNNVGENNYGHKLTSEIVRMICKYLVQYDGNAHKVHEFLKIDGFDVSCSIINKIKNKSSWVNISDQYFAKNDFRNMKCGENHYNAKLSEETIRLICKLILKYNGSIVDVNNELHMLGIDNISNDHIGDIKRKHNWKSISSEYFNYKNGQIIPKVE